jgi:hypothetical protein
MTQAQRLRRIAADIYEEYFDLLATYNRMYDTSSGHDPRLAAIDRDLDQMLADRRRMLDRARMLEVGAAAA